jgi:RAB protein geranylgeranyltransferase component A
MFNDQFLNVPFSKSEIFISNDLDLLEKQKLLNFIFSVMKLKNNNVDVTVL